MLAPAVEAVLDPVSAGHFELYRDALCLWPAFAAGIGAATQPCGALWVARDGADREMMLGRLQAIGAAAEVRSAEEAAQLSPGLVAPAGAVFTAEDGRLEPRAMLAAMRAVFEREGGRIRQASL